MRDMRPPVWFDSPPRGGHRHATCLSHRPCNLQSHKYLENCVLVQLPHPSRVFREVSRRDYEPPKRGQHLTKSTEARHVPRITERLHGCRFNSQASHAKRETADLLSAVSLPSR